MTRFARAKGSKASNQRVPEEATPWKVMKQELDRKNNNKNSDGLDQASSKNVLEAFQKTSDNASHWAEFSDTENSYSMKGSAKKINKKNVKTKNLAEKGNQSEKDGEANGEMAKIKNSKTKLNKKRKLEQLGDTGTNKKEQVIVDKSKKKKSETNIVTQNCNQTEQQSDQLEKLNMKLEGGEQINVDKSKKKKRKKNIVTQNCKQTEQQSNQFQKNIKLEKTQNNSLNRKVFKRKEDGTHTTNVSKKFKNEKNGNQKFKTTKYKDFKRRKPKTEECIIGGKNITLMYIDGFPVKKEDGERLLQLKKDMISKGIPKSEIERAMKLERRRAEKALAHEKKKRCFNCRGIGHVLSECPNVSQEEVDCTTSGICFKCGSTEHTHFQCKVVKSDAYKFAQCFICKEQGHIARQCPDNAKGLYPRGGACKVCGDVTHLKKDCPSYIAQQEETKVLADTIDNKNIESIDVRADNAKNVVNSSIKKQKIVKF